MSPPSFDYYIDCPLKMGSIVDVKAIAECILIVTLLLKIGSIVDVEAIHMEVILLLLLLKKSSIVDVEAIL